jgi:hypothetical protein
LVSIENKREECKKDETYLILQVQRRVSNGHQDLGSSAGIDFSFELIHCIHGNKLVQRRLCHLFANKSSKVKVFVKDGPVS